MKRGVALLSVVVSFCAITLLGGAFCLSFFKVLRLGDKLGLSAMILAQDIRDLQLSSMTSRGYSRLYIDFSNLERYLKVYPDSKVVERRLPREVRVSSFSFTEGYLSFSPSGAPLKGGYISLTDGKRRLYVIVAVTTGRVRISERLP